MKFTIIAGIVLISALVQADSATSYADPATPYIDKQYDVVIIEDTKKTKVYLSSCSINKTSIKYFGNRPVCMQSLTCNRGEISKVAIVEPSSINASIHCAISSAIAGCKSKTWQDCMIDNTFPDNLDMSCASDTPGATKPGCPNVDSQGSSQKSETGAR